MLISTLLFGSEPRQQFYVVGGWWGQVGGGTLVSLTNEKTKDQEKLIVQIYTARNRKWLTHVGLKYSSKQTQ